jgi:hypothetical protein
MTEEQRELTDEESNSLASLVEEAVHRLDALIESYKPIVAKMNDIQDAAFRRWDSDPEKQIRDPQYQHWKETEENSDDYLKRLSHFQAARDLLALADYEKEIEAKWIDYLKQKTSREKHATKPRSGPLVTRRLDLSWLLNVTSTLVKSHHLSVLENL